MYYIQWLIFVNHNLKFKAHVVACFAFASKLAVRHFYNPHITVNHLVLLLIGGIDVMLAWVCRSLETTGLVWPRSLASYFTWVRIKCRLLNSYLRISVSSAQKPLRHIVYSWVCEFAIVTKLANTTQLPWVEIWGQLAIFSVMCWCITLFNMCFCPNNLYWIDSWLLNWKPMAQFTNEGNVSDTSILSIRPIKAFQKQ